MKTFLCLALSALPLAAAPCASLRSFSAPNTTIEFAETASASAMAVPGGLIDRVPAFCRVGGVVRPVADSEIRFEVWLPEKNWNGKYRGVGNGGFAGTINYSEMAAAVRDGYATASTNTGHRAGGEGAPWALGHPEKIKDFGYRAIHETTVVGKAMAQAFYEAPLQRAYFSSCSNGGRQALMEAQRYPEDFDGIIAGAPAYFWTHLITANYYAAALPMMNDPASYLSKAKIPAIAKAVRAACGDAEGIVTDPPSCHFDPATLVCQGAETDSCLTQKQAESLKRIYAGAVGIYPGYEPGDEEGPGGWAGWITGDKPGTSAGVGFSQGFLRHMLFADPAWTAKGTDLTSTLPLADEKMGPLLNATNPDLQAFQKRGGKLILYHGWADAAIPPTDAIRYFENVRQTMGAQTVNDFARLYMVAGMQHCGGGSGPNVFGQVAALPPGDARHDVFTALVDWVEKGSAPGNLVATKYTDNDLRKPVASTRALCAYPAKSCSKP